MMTGADCLPAPVKMPAATPQESPRGGLIINELVTNALKYAFTGRPAGKLCVALHHRPDHTFSLVVKDDGAGLPPDFETRSRSSLGMQLVGVLVHQLGGTLETKNEGGAQFVLQFPEKF